MKDILSNQNVKNLQVEEEHLIVWADVLNKLQLAFGNDIYESWIRSVNLKKEFNHYVVLSAPTRFVRDWIVSRYADKVLDIIRTFKKSIQRIEFLIEEQEVKYSNEDKRKGNPISFIQDSALNYNRFNLSYSFNNFMLGESNELAYTAAKKVCAQSSHYNPLFIYSAVGMGKTHLLNAIGLEIGKIMKWLNLKIYFGEQIFLLLMIFNLFKEKKLCRKSFFILSML